MNLSKGKEMEEVQSKVKVREEMMYVAVSTKIKKDRPILRCALQNSGGKKVCIIHVHQPAKRIPTPDGFMPSNSSKEEEVKAFRDKEREEMNAVLDEYLRFSVSAEKVIIEKLYIEADSFEKGIIQLVEQQNIGKLVIGARSYCRRMAQVTSRKAVYVRDNAPSFCHIWFICQGYLIHTREAVSPPRSSGVDNEPVSGERNAESESPTAPPFEASALTPPRWSTNGFDGLVSRSGSTREFSEGRHSLSSPMYPHSMSLNESGKATGLESLYIEECLRRREAETELAKAREELEWMKKHVAELPKKKEELENSELHKVKAELEHMKNNVLGELRMRIEQKSSLKSHINNSTFFLGLLGKNLDSAISVVRNWMTYEANSGGET